jgi:hypothetical protein
MHTCKLKSIEMHTFTYTFSKSVGRKCRGGELKTLRYIAPLGASVSIIYVPYILYVAPSNI